AATRPADAGHLVDGAAGIGEVVQRRAAVDEVERVVEERERLGVRLLQDDVRDAGLLQSAAAEREQLTRQVDADNGTHVRGDLLGDVCRAARDLERERVLVQRLEPREVRVATRREQRLVAAEQADLPAERRANRVLVRSGHPSIRRSSATSRSSASPPGLPYHQT